MSLPWPVTRSVPPYLLTLLLSFTSAICHFTFAIFHFTFAIYHLLPLSFIHIFFLIFSLIPFFSLIYYYYFYFFILLIFCYFIIHREHTKSLRTQREQFPLYKALSLCWRRETFALKPPTRRPTQRNLSRSAQVRIVDLETVSYVYWDVLT